MKGHGIAAIVAGIVIGVSHIATAHEGGHEESVSGSTAFTAVTPILNVESVEASIAHYTSVLGFKKNWDWPAEEEDKTFASISNGEVTVFLSEKGQGARPVWIYYSVDNVDELHEKLARARGGDQAGARRPALGGAGDARCRQGRPHSAHRRPEQRRAR